MKAAADKVPGLSHGMLPAGGINIHSAHLTDDILSISQPG
jgi:hypothetical protein